METFIIRSNTRLDLGDLKRNPNLTHMVFATILSMGLHTLFNRYIPAICKSLFSYISLLIRNRLIFFLFLATVTLASLITKLDLAINLLALFQILHCKQLLITCKAAVVGWSGLLLLGDVAMTMLVQNLAYTYIIASTFVVE